MEEEPVKEKELECRKNTLAYLVSYCDIMTLCLTFFIILTTMAAEQKELAFESGIGSFRTDVKTLGLSGILSGGRDMNEKKHLQPESGSVLPFVDKDMTYHVDADVEEDGYESLESDVAETLEKGGQVQLSTGIFFDKGKSTLTFGDRRRLRAMLEALSALKGKIQIVGLTSDDEGGLSDAYRLALKRAKAVYDGLALKGSKRDVSLRGYNWPASSELRDPKGSRTVEIVVSR